MRKFQSDLDTWRIPKKALRLALSDRRLELGEEEVCLVMRFLLDHLEDSVFEIVPVKPIAKMQLAIKHALDSGKRISIGWVKPRTKQRWRYQAALEAAPDWRRGYDHRRHKADREARHIQTRKTSIPLLTGRADQPASSAHKMQEVMTPDRNFKVDPHFHTRFKMTAAAAGKSVKELLEDSYVAWMERPCGNRNG